MKLKIGKFMEVMTDNVEEIILEKIEKQRHMNKQGEWKEFGVKSRGIIPKLYELEIWGIKKKENGIDKIMG